MLGSVKPSIGIRLVATSALVLGLAACGGGGGGDDSATSAGTGSTTTGSDSGSGSGSSAGTGSTSSTDTGTDSSTTVTAGDGTSTSTTTDTDTNTGTGTNTSTGSTTDTTTAAATTATRADAYRLLTQATFGPTTADINSVMTTGAAAWIDSQLAVPFSGTYVARFDADNAALQAAGSGSADASSPISQFYLNALSSKDQLRQRVAFALSQIMVISTAGGGASGRAAAAYMDMLGRDAFGNYRTLIQDVAMHPAMGAYLTSIHNVKENTTTGQLPDQNFAREVMQLMSIGLVQLNTDGTPKLTSGSQSDTYTTDDIVGMSKIFTGWSYSGPDTSDIRFWGWWTSAQDPDRLINSMQAYPQFHSLSDKTFLGVTVGAQQTATPAADLKTALDTLFNHPNVGPFISRQLIQRLVTSSPSSAYVGRVAAVFNGSGGTRGDLKAVVRAILLDPEARAATGTAYGKVREPVLRLTAWMRAFNATTDSGKALVRTTDDPGRELGQTPLRSRSVFNFYRPAYIAPGTATGALGLTMPELQITNEASVAGYINYMTTVVASGVGSASPINTALHDVRADYSADLALADTTSSLVDDVTLRLLGDAAPDSLKSLIRTAVDSITIPALNTKGTNTAAIQTARNNRVYTAVLLTLASPEFIVQK